MKFIKKHRMLIIILFVCIILFLLATLAVYRMFYPGKDKSIYGNRLAGAKEISNVEIEKIKDEILATKLVNNVTYNLNVVTMKFFIDVKDNTKIASAMTLSDIINKNLSNEIKEFYDIEIYLTQKEGKFVEYPAIGYKSKSANSFSWTINKVGATNEE